MGRAIPFASSNLNGLALAGAQLSDARARAGRSAGTWGAPWGYRGVRPASRRRLGACEYPRLTFRVTSLRTFHAGPRGEGSPLGMVYMMISLRRGYRWGRWAAFMLP